MPITAMKYLPQKTWYAQNKRKCNLYSSAYYAKHREELKARAKKRYRETKNNHDESTD